MAGEDSPILAAEALAKRFGGVIALDDYAIRLGRDDLVGLIGPNGAGKTTAFNLLSGVLRPSAGRILVDGVDVTGRPTHAIARLGVARTFQTTRLFGDLSVLENVMAGLHMRHGAGLAATVLGLPRLRASEAEIAGAAYATLAFVGLEARAGLRAGDLAFGDQRKVEIARALATEPRALLLDEPAAGMNPAETAALAELIRRIHDERRTAVLVVEHDMSLVMRLCKRVQVIDRGRCLAMGAPGEVQNDPAVIEAYLGSAAHA